MADFKLTDSLGASFSLAPDIAGLKLGNPALKNAQAALSFKPIKPLEIGGVAITVQAGAKAACSFAPEDRKVTAEFTLSVNAKMPVPHFAFDANATLRYRAGCRFDAGLTAGEAIAAALESMRLPFDVDAIKGMAAGSFVSITGSGALTFSGKTALPVAPVPLLSAALPAPLPKIDLSAGASIDVGASFQISTSYEMRVEKDAAGQVELAFTRSRGSEVKISAGASATFGGADLFLKLLPAIGKDSAADADELTHALGGARAQEIQATVKSAVEKTLEAGLHYQFSALSSKGSEFRYAIDLDRLGAGGLKAVTSALHGDLSGVDGLPAGVRCHSSAFKSLHESSHALRVNLLGIYNCISVSKLAVTGECSYEPETGQLTICDSTAANRLNAVIDNTGARRADLHNLRSVLADSFQLTATFHAQANAIGAPPALNASQTYFELHGDTDAATLRDELDAAVGLDLMTRDEQNAAVAGAQFGRTLAWAEANYGDDDVTALFLKDGEPRPIEDYERAGREALQIVAHEDYRLRPARNDELWRTMRSTGNEFGPLFPGLRKNEIAAIKTDYLTIVWWAKAMAGASERLAAMRRLIKRGADARSSEFKALHDDLVSHMKNVTANTKPEFGRPWGLVAVNMAVAHMGEASFVLSGPVVALRASRPLAAVAG